MMKKYALFLTCLLATVTSMRANQEDLLVLIPEGCGDIALIDSQTVETRFVTCSSYSDGMVHSAAYKDGAVVMVISGTTSSAKREIGLQKIFREGKEISQSREYFLDQNNPNTIIHIHNRYVVSTSPRLQTISPKK